MEDKRPVVKQKKSLTGSIDFLSSIIAILMGLLFGTILLLCFNPTHAFEGLTNLLSTGFSSPEKFAKVLYQAAPLMMCGLSVGIAFKTNLFNIGASGQYMIGAMCALIGALAFKMPWYMCLIMSMVGGGIWGLFPGLFKALFNVNEVIAAIMFNWIGLFTMNVVISNIPTMLAGYYGSAVNNRTGDLSAANAGAIIPRLGVDKVMNSNYMNISSFIANVMAIIIHIILNKTTFGYELKACGYNRDAAQYAGVNSKRNIIITMVISGALAGLGGAIFYLAGTAQYTIEKNLLGMGFDGISVALLANSSPLGTILSALFISYIRVGGQAMQPTFATEYVDIILGVIIYFSAFSLLMKNVIVKILKRKKKEKEEIPPNAIPSGKEDQ